MGVAQSDSELRRHDVGYERCHLVAAAALPWSQAVIDDAVARAFLAGPLGAERIETTRPGEWSKVYAITRRSEELIVRFSRWRDDFEKDRAVARWRNADLPVPEVLEIGEVAGSAYAVSRLAHGGPLEELDANGLRRVLPRLFAALDAMRAIDLSATTGYGGWDVHHGGQQASWRDSLLTVGATVPPGRNEGWRERLAESPDAADAFARALDAVTELADACPEDRHLIHDDLLNRNVLVEDDRIAAVLDWGSSMYGDFLYDVALLVYGRDWVPAWSGVDVAALFAEHYRATGFDVPRFYERVRCYALRQGLSGIGYNVWKGHAANLAWHVARTRELLAAL